MDKVKELLADPAKLEATIKDSWTKIDTKNEGEVNLILSKLVVNRLLKKWVLQKCFQQLIKVKKNSRK